MRVSGVLVGLFMLLVSIHGLEDATVTCTEHWLHVRIKRRVYLNYLLPQPYELYLGTGCVVTSTSMEFFEFFYPLSQCGIKTDERPWGILIESSVTFEPENLVIRGYIPISCYIQRNVFFLGGPHKLYPSLLSVGTKL